MRKNDNTSRFVASCLSWPQWAFDVVYVKRVFVEVDQEHDRRASLHTDAITSGPVTADGAGACEHGFNTHSGDDETDKKDRQRPRKQRIERLLV